MMKRFRFTVFLVLCALSAHAEFRIWTGENGQKIRAEFVRPLLGRIQIRDASGRLHLIAMDKLSESDMDYVLTQTLPEVDITVRKTSRIRPPMEWTIPGDQTILYTFTTTISKESRMESKAQLTAELYIIGEMVDSDDWVLIDRAVSKFVFPEGKDSQHEFIAKDIPCRTYEAAWANDGGGDLSRGVEYTGYVAVVLDSKNEVFAYETDMETESWTKIGIPEAVGKLRKLYIDGRGSQFSRIFNETITKSKVPQIEWYKRTKVF